MAMLVRRDPTGDVLERATRWVDDLWRDLAWITPEPGYAPVDMHTGEDTVVVKAVLPGVRAEDVEVTVEGRRLRIRAGVEEEREEKGRRYHLRERHWGRWYREVSLPWPVEVQRAQATLENGVLTVTLPVAERAGRKPRRIKVKGTGLPARWLRRLSRGVMRR